MPEQTTAEGAEYGPNSSYELPFSPGFPEGPVWPVEVWFLSSFQVTLTGTLIVRDELELSPETEILPVILALEQSGRPVWSQNLPLRLVPELGTDKQRFNFKIGVFVDLTNPLPYDATAQMRFVVSGLVPVYKPPGPTFESETLERLGQLLEAIQIGNLTQGEVISAVTAVLEAVEANEATTAEAVTALENAGVTQEEMVALLETIAANTE